MSIIKGNEIPTIDVSAVTIKPATGDEILIKTASKVAVSVQSETEDAVKLVVKGQLIAQKPSVTTITGNTIVLTDNVFNAEVVKLFQGGTIKYWTSEAKTTEGDTDTGFGVSSYTPPVAGSTDKGEITTLCCYSAIYGADGVVSGYEKIEYPNCQGTPVALSSEDGAFRAPEYTINSAPKTSEAPYKISYVDSLPQ